jgi:hypothetical protein
MPPQMQPQICISLRLLSNWKQGSAGIDIDRFRQQFAQVLDHLADRRSLCIAILALWGSCTIGWHRWIW